MGLCVVLFKFLSGFVIGWTYTGLKLKFLLDRIIKKLDNAVGKPEYADIKPVNIIVLTDGAPSRWHLIPASQKDDFHH